MRPEPKREISCLIGSLFATVEPPCGAEAVGELTITGTTRSGKKATLAITGDAFVFYGDQEDLMAATGRACPHKHRCPLTTTEKGAPMAEKEYLLGNRAKELLIYTTKATRPVGDDKVGVSEVTAFFKRLADAETPQQTANELNVTIQKMATRRQKKRGFPKSATFTYITDLRDTALRIVKNVHAANECMFTTEHERRLELIKDVLDDCNLMLQLIEISLDLEFIDIKKCQHWTKLVTNVKYMCASWRKKDAARAKKIMEEERQKQLQDQAVLFRQIIQEVMARN